MVAAGEGAQVPTDPVLSAHHAPQALGHLQEGGVDIQDQPVQAY